MELHQQIYHLYPGLSEITFIRSQMKNIRVEITKSMNDVYDAVKNSSIKEVGSFWVIYGRWLTDDDPISETDSIKNNIEENVKSKN